MLSEEAKKRLERQKYAVVGNHSAVKVCGWTKKYMTGEGGCYKFHFYGIASHKCLQMTTSMSCANRCIYCWRDYKAPVSMDWKWSIDEPEIIIEESLKAQKKQLSGMGGHPRIVSDLWKESLHVAHVALSLTGEPITYPKFNEALNLFHQKGISTFVVTNAQYPEKIEAIDVATQLYISVDAPDKIISKKIGKPLFPNFWERFNESLEIMRDKKFRTTIRMTMIKNMNMDKSGFLGYGRIIERGSPDFIEIKAYMFIGASRQRLTIENMPRHHEIVEFADEFSKYINSLGMDYDVVMDHKPSRVVLLAKKRFAKKHWIDFTKFFDLINSADGDKDKLRNIDAMDYLALQKPFILESNKNKVDSEEIVE